MSEVSIVINQRYSIIEILLTPLSYKDGGCC